MQKNIKKLSILAAAAAAAMFTGCASDNGMGTDVERQEGEIHIKALIDGRDIVFFKGNNIWIQHMAYALPGQWAGQNRPIEINTGKNRRDGRESQKWNLEWSGNLTKQEIIEDSPPIPSSGKWDASNFKVDFSTVGYGIARVKSYPSAINDYTLVLEFDDVEPDGAHWYSADISWTNSDDRAGPPAE